MKSLLFIFNPWSGKAHIKDHLFDIVDGFTKAGYIVTTYPTQRSRDCYEYIMLYGTKFDIIVCSGGDGTLNEAVAGILDNPDCDAGLGYIPSGSTNDFAMSLQIPKSVHGAVKNIVGGSEYLCDVGRFNGRAFNYVAAFGLFTDVSYATPQQLKNMLGHQAYIIESFKSFANLKKYKIKVTCNDEMFEDEYIYGMVANSKQVGGIKGLLGNDVKLNDGKFEVLMVKSLKTPTDMQNLVNGFMMQENNMTVRRVSTDHITFESEEPIPWVLDGEFGGEQTHVDIVVEQERVKYILSMK